MKVPRHRGALRRLGIASLAATGLLALGGVSTQWVLEHRDELATPPPGRLVAANDTRLHLDCRGPRDAGPTVLLEAGATGWSSTWAWVQPDVAEHARVCAIDRAGLGWSPAFEGPVDARSHAHRLAEALDRAGERGPFVLAGHSLGGLYITAFAKAYPERTAGLVYVDASHPAQWERFPADFAGSRETFEAFLDASPWLARLGVLRATDALGRNARSLPDQSLRAVDRFAASPAHLSQSAREMAAWDESAGFLSPLPTLGGRPVVALSAARMEGASDKALATWHGLHAELAALSRQGRHEVVPGSDHFTLLMDQRFSGRVVAAILETGRKATEAPGPGKKRYQVHFHSD